MNQFMRVLIVGLAFCSLSSFKVVLKPIQPITAYIQLMSNAAVENMRLNGVPASITLAQAIRESGAGNSRLAKEANNHFGIKCFNWPGGKYLTKGGTCYRAYVSVEECVYDYGRILSTLSRYKSLFALDPCDYKAWAHGLKKAGYASQKNYAQLIIKLIEEYNLYEYDLVALNYEMVPIEKQEVIEPVSNQKFSVQKILHRKPHK